MQTRLPTGQTPARFQAHTLHQRGSKRVPRRPAPHRAVPLQFLVRSRPRPCVPAPSHAECQELNSAGADPFANTAASPSPRGQTKSQRTQREILSWVKSRFPDPTSATIRTRESKHFSLRHRPACALATNTISSAQGPRSSEGRQAHCFQRYRGQRTGPRRISSSAVDLGLDPRAAGVEVDR
jgi:hypothetical protein